MDENQPLEESPLRTIDWLAKFLNCTQWAAYNAVRTKRIPSQCVVKLGRQIRLNETLVRAWANNSLAEAK